jgi:hypothetical protein
MLVTSAALAGVAAGLVTGLTALDYRQRSNGRWQLRGESAP